MMTTKNRIKTVLTIVIVAIVAIAPAANAEVIYSETFDGDGSTGLDGIAPTIGEGTWAAKGNDWLLTNGTVVGGTANNTFAGANLLPFEPELDKLYTLSMDLNHTGIKYIGLGFSKFGIHDSSKQDTGYRFPQNGGIAFMEYGQGGTIKMYEGLGAYTDGEKEVSIPNTGIYVSDTWVNLAIVLDTTGDGSTFTADFQIDGVSITGGAFTIDAVTLDDINYCGIGAYGTRSGSADGSQIDNFSLTVGLDDPNLPSVDAGGDMISWSGQAVTMDPNVVNNDTAEPQGTLIYAWTAEPNGVGEPDLDVAITGANTENASVTITKTVPTGDATVVTMTLAVTLEDNEPVKNSMAITVYDDACLAAKAAGLAVIDRTDLDDNCITNFKDFALMAATWLDDYALTEAVAK